ncbi:GGDEF domain-containing protein [Rhizobium sp. B230/85]|uniref:GGDEF domain-containing protein n=1 Tax=unclassified Rhizobium TaxID=2613769 RepID=UPI001ADD2E78|nr:MULTISPECIES: GGDEF domain-containing protein [unclassified Rhizobium]MBO9133993.1 GGDEF domain-containing protein [Rhizobium sp. B209b/85]QXZ96872.1 GGDEF domain-containing protein [Rhizobium sp. B230/85]
MRLPRSAALKKFGSSLTLKIFSICFLATHLPLLALIAYLLTGYEAAAMPILATALLATLLGTGLCFLSVWLLLRPLEAVTKTVQAYRETGAVSTIRSQRRDEIGVVVNAVSTLIAELHATLSQLRRQATTDVLTGLGNRRWLRDIGTSELQRAERENEPLCVIVFDLDHFKTINDEHGHEVGDQVLTVTGAIIQHNMRPYDIAARIGGEEFCILLPRTDTAQAIAIAERLRRELATRAVGPVPAGRITASFGVYCGDPTTETLKTMMMAADRKLYAAKNGGRNAVHWDTARPVAEVAVRQ